MITKQDRKATTKPTKTPKMSVVNDPQVPSQQYEGPARMTATKKYEAQPPIKLGVNPTVAAVVSSLQDKNAELAMQIRENNHTITILRMVECLRAGENPHPEAKFTSNNSIIEIPQPPKMVVEEEVK
jgi:hypothetical protein